MKPFSIEDFDDKIDSLYRLVIVAAHRANQVNKPETRPLVAARSKKATMVALEEILDGKVTYRVGANDEEEYVE